MLKVFYGQCNLLYIIFMTLLVGVRSIGWRDWVVIKGDLLQVVSWFLVKGKSIEIDDSLNKRF